VFLTRYHSGDQINVKEMDGELECMERGEVNKGLGGEH
jgi:hypothetical protein